MLIDTHCHLNDERLEKEADGIVAAFFDDNLEAVVNVGSDVSSSVSAYNSALKYEKVYAAVGIHPQESQGKMAADYDLFIKQAQSDKVIAIGEIGLDYFYETSPRAVQRVVMAEQMELAYSLKLPTIFHLRDAYEDFLRLIKENSKYLEYGAVLHCYSGTVEYMKELLKFDFYYGFDGPITYKNARHSVEALLAAPREKILFETDAPYMAPVPFRGQTNYPKHVNEIARRGAELLGLSFEKLCEQTTNNAKILFKRIK
jgi:hydrolase, TatD family